MRKMASHHQTLFGVRAVQLLRSAMIGHFRFVIRERLPIRTVPEKGHSPLSSRVTAIWLNWF